uniref:Uncharacterized protein n=1 Tax=Anguilla anguilla TaxID=7936 RepID=A0A0E9TVC5_ANGAN
MDACRCDFDLYKKLGQHFMLGKDETPAIFCLDPTIN